MPRILLPSRLQYISRPMWSTCRRNDRARCRVVYHILLLFCHRSPERGMSAMVQSDGRQAANCLHSPSTDTGTPHTSAGPILLRDDRFGSVAF